MSDHITSLARFAEVPWPGIRLKPHPGDFQRFLYAPQLGDTDPYYLEDWPPEDSPDEEGGPEIGFFDPLSLGPVDAGAYGTVYFEYRPGSDAPDAIWRLLGIDLGHRDFAVYRARPAEYQEVMALRYLEQIRIVSHEALVRVFGADAGTIAEEDGQPVDVGHVLRGFLDAETERWGTGYSWELGGTLGGDGDWARETLSFGFMVENAPLGVCRIWSKPWLVTK